MSGKNPEGRAGQAQVEDSRRAYRELVRRMRDHELSVAAVPVARLGIHAEHQIAGTGAIPISAFALDPQSDPAASNHAAARDLERTRQVRYADSTDCPTATLIRGVVASADDKPEIAFSA